MAETPSAEPIVTAQSLGLEEVKEKGVPWLQWGPYLSEREWGAVREGYSDNGDVWNYLSHDQARSRAYHWGADGLAGISDDQQRLCFHSRCGTARIRYQGGAFGLTNSEANHGENVKEYNLYLDKTPAHSHLKYL